MQSFKAQIVDLDSTVWKYGIIVPIQIAEKFLELKDKRVICTLNQKEKIHAALMPKGNNTWFINLNKQVRKSLQVEEGDSLELELKTDDSTYGMEVCEEFEELMKQDKIGKKVFESLTMGKQRTLIHQINQGKTIQTRLNKALIILDYLVEVNGQLDYKGLNAAFKKNRFR